MLPIRKNLRLDYFDYSTPGGYFITICTQDRRHLFGNVRDEKMILNEAGRIVDLWWNNIPNHFSDVELDLSIVMPNHFHGIVYICRGGVPPPAGRETRPLPTLGQIVGYFKYQTTKCINELNKTLGQKLWQRNYHEHIIRTETDLQKMRDYVIHNPLQWHLDEYYTL